jgi:gluconate kinase
MLTLITISAGILVTLYFCAVFEYNSRHMNKTLYIVRGLPGSGKSTLAAQMAEEKGITYHETDQFLYNDAGVYEWSEERLGRAIDLCYDQVLSKINDGKSVIAVGCYTRWRAFRDYVELGHKHGYQVEIITCLGEFGSIHGIPKDKYEKMKTRFIASKALPQQAGIKYTEHLPEPCLF